MTRHRVPRIPFEKISRAVLPKNYQLSLVLCSDPLARKINRAYRKKSYAANVLSFPLGKREGELFLNVQTAAREAVSFGVPLRARLILLFVHGCLHLKGMRHGKKMERIEATMLKRFA
jgi:probable rRNA maturation factor